MTEGQFLSLGRKEGGYPWDYEGLLETPQSAGTGDNGESLFTFSFGGVDVAYLDADGTDNIYRMTTTVPGPRTLGGIQVGDSEDDVKPSTPVRCRWRRWARTSSAPTTP